MTFKRTDANQKKVVNHLRRMGCTVQHLHMVGKGCPDILVGWSSRNFLFEIKDSEKTKSQKRLTPDEFMWHEKWRGQVDVIETADEAYEIITKSFAR